MRGYVGDDSILGEDDGRRIAVFLTMYTGEGELIVPEGAERDEVEPEPPGPLSTAVEETFSSEPLKVEELVAEIETVSELVQETVVESPEEVESSPALEVKPAVESKPVEPVAAVKSPKSYMPLLKGIWNPGRTALKFARMTGFFAVACLLGLLVRCWRILLFSSLPSAKQLRHHLSMPLNFYLG